MQPVVAVACDTRAFENYVWHAAPETYLRAALDIAGLVPLLVPAFGDRIAVGDLLARVDGVMLTGSRTNVHPARYDAAPTAAHEPYDEPRDATAIPLARAALEAGKPLFVICRGMQELNVALGGSLAAEIQDLPGRRDHRAPHSDDQDERFALVHDVTPRAGGAVGAIVGEAAIRVNSLHRQAVDALSPALRVEAAAEDGTVEAVSVKDAAGFAVGVQWHPEYWAKTDAPSRRLFEAFGAAVRAQAIREPAQ